MAAVKEALLAEADVPDWVVDTLRDDPDEYIAVLADSHRKQAPPRDLSDT